jgi:ketosteroid isomerase-like protein
MSTRNVFFVVMLWATIVMGQSVAWVSGQDEQLSQELVEVREGLAKAYNTGDLDLLLSYCHDDVIAVWQTGHVAMGHQGVRDVVNEITKEGGVLAGYSANPTVEHRTLLSDGNVVVSMGKLNDTYTLTQPKGTEVQLNSNWTAALAKFDDRWLVTSFHVSANAFDNEVITLYSNMARWFNGAIGGAIGLVVGLVIGIFFARRKKLPEAAK